MSAAIRVLLVEDNPGDADLTRDTLEDSRIHLDITVVVDGVEAIDYLLRRGAHANATTPDLIILDLNLPGMDGRAVLAEARRHPHLRSIPVVILTSSDAERDVVQTYELGANCYITKPVDLSAFQAIVRSIEGFWFTVVRLP
jgi:chemotaxis family two-component system response regulator Rcp1